jgi:hypothetical protein
LKKLFDKEKKEKELMKSLAEEVSVNSMKPMGSVNLCLERNPGNNLAQEMEQLIKVVCVENKWDNKVWKKGNMIINQIN